MFRVTEGRGPAMVLSAGNLSAPEAANTAAVVTLGPTPSRKEGFLALIWSYIGDVPTNGKLTIEVGGEVLFTWPIPCQGQDSLMFPWAMCSPVDNVAMTITLAAGGEGVVGKLNVIPGLTY